MEQGDLFGDNRSAVEPKFTTQAEVTIEPVHNGHCVMVKASDHKPMFGFIANAATAEAVTAQVAVYSSFRNTLKAATAKSEKPDGAASKQEVMDEIDRLEKVLDWFRKSVDVKDEREASARRKAAEIRDAVQDATLALEQVGRSLHGMKQREVNKWN